MMAQRYGLYNELIRTDTNADERRLITSANRKGREKRKAQQHKSVSMDKIIRPGTRMTRIGRIYTDSGVEWLEKAPWLGEAMIVFLSRINKPQMNTDERRFVHRASAFSMFIFREQIENHENYFN